MTDTKIAPLNTRSIINISGEDAAAFLQGIISQNIDGMENDDIRFSTLLTPQGKVLFDFFVIKIDDGFLLDCFAPASEALVKRLKLYKLRAKVDITLRDDVSVYAFWGDACEALIPDGAATDPRHASLGWRSLVKAATPNASEADYHHHRIGLGVPQFGDDFSGEEVFLLDVNYDVLNGVDYKKGCFVGQEVTSRMKRKGEVRKRTACITLPQGKSALAKGADITAGETTLGTVLAVGSEHHAIGIVRVDRLEKADAQDHRPSIAENDVEILIPVYLKDA